MSLSYDDIMAWFEANWAEFIVVVRDEEGNGVGYVQQDTPQSGIYMTLALLGELEAKMPIRISTPGFPLPVDIKTIQTPDEQGNIIPIPPPFSWGTDPDPVPPPVLPSDNPPYATALSASAQIRAGTTVDFTYTYNHYDGIAEGSTIKQLLRAETGGTVSILPATSIASGLRYTFLLDDIGHQIAFEVTPVAVSGTNPTGAKVGVDYPAVAQPLTNPPTFDSVTIGGVSTPPVVGELAIATANGYSSTEVNGAPVPAGTHIWQWQSSPDDSTWTDISGATSSSYSIPADQETNYLRCFAIPVAAYGTNLTGTAVYSASGGPVAAATPSSIPAWWPSTSSPTAGWGADANPRCVSPTTAGKGPHPVGYTTYVDMLIDDNLTSQIGEHRTRYNLWDPNLTTNQGGEKDPMAAISLVVLHELATRGASSTPTAAECVTKAEQYIALFGDGSQEVVATTGNGWWVDTNGTGIGARAEPENWPSGWYYDQQGRRRGGIGFGFHSQQTLAILYGHLKGDLDATLRLRAEEHALWWMRENKVWRAEWSLANLQAGFDHFQCGWQLYWEAYAWKNSHMAGVIWLLMEFYDSTDAEWQSLAEFYGDLIHNKYLPYYQGLVLGHNYVDADDQAMWNSNDYYYLMYQHHITLLLCLEVGTGLVGYNETTASPYWATTHRYTYGAHYRTYPESYATSPADKYGHGWNICQNRQAKLSSQASQSMKHFLARTNDPIMLDLMNDYLPLQVWPYNKTSFHEVDPDAATTPPWWFFRDASTTPTSWETLPLYNRSLGPAHSMVRTQWVDNADACYFTYRSGNTSLHHSDIRPGDVQLVCRGHLLPQTMSYMSSYRSLVDFCQRKYHGIHIFDPADPSNDCALRYHWQGAGLNQPHILPRDGGPKRCLEPYVWDIGQSYSSHGAGAAGNWVFDRYGQQLIRMQPESNHDMEQSRERDRGFGTVSGVKWHSESWDWTPMFTKWPFEYNFSTSETANPPFGDKRYQACSRTTRVIHPNGYVRVITWLDPGGGCEDYPPVIIVYDQVQATDDTFPVELHWHSVMEPVHVGTNHWTFTDQRNVEACVSWSWEPTYRSGIGRGSTYQYDGILHIQMWDGTTALAASDNADVTWWEGPNVYEDGILAGNTPINYAGWGGKQSGGATETNPRIDPADTAYGPVIVANWTMALHPATGSVYKRFLTVMNPDINVKYGGATAKGKYPTAVTDNGTSIEVEVTLDGGARTVTIDTTSFEVTVA